ncbi:MAG: MFS transporter, partial [Bacteroidota bacterium]
MGSGNGPISAGPAAGGLIIGTLGYGGLFWVDGGTCILAGMLLWFLLNPRKAKVMDQVENSSPKSAYRDLPYTLFIGALVLYGFIFVQYFSTVPLYYKEERLITEYEIGLLLAMNGFLI